MRTPFLACLLIASVPACVIGPGEITGVGDGVETGEGGGGGGGGGEGEGEGTGGGGSTATPRVTAAVDKATMSTELGKAETVTISLTSVDGFAGDVSLSASLVDMANGAIPGITVNGPATVTLNANGTGTAAFSITVATDATGVALNGQLKVAVSSPAGVVDVTSAITINNSFTLDYPTNTGTATANHPGRARTVNVKRGTVLRFTNTDTIDHIIHGGGAFSGNHENTTTGGAPGRTYQIQTIGVAPGGSGTLGCHSHGADSYATYVVQ
jgi:hypothetical protein